MAGERQNSPAYFMAKQFTVRVKDLTTEELYGLLRHMPVRTLLQLAKFHVIPTSPATVALDLAQNKKCFTTLTFNLGFNI